MNRSLCLRSTRILTPEGLISGEIQIVDGRIASITDEMSFDVEGDLVDVEDRVVMPGLVDCHVHINDPGREEWEGFETATRAAAAGGVTTLVDMPLNSVPATVDLDGLRAKEDAARGRCFVDVGFWGGVVGQDGRHLEELYEAGVMGFKCFLCPSGVDEFPSVGGAALEAAGGVLAGLGATLLAHCEDPEALGVVEDSIEPASSRSYANYLASRPPLAEDLAVATMIGICRTYGLPVHIVHLATASSVAQIATAKSEGLPVTVETCPHYLYFDAGMIEDGQTWFKCAPPIRSEAHREGLWGALESGVIDFVVTDHSPCPPEMKRLDSGSFFSAWGGIASLQLSLPIMWTIAKRRGIPLCGLLDWVCDGPARLANLDTRKGRIAVGYDADLVIWSPESSFEVVGEALYHKHALTPYDGETLFGVVEATYLRGRCVFEAGQVIDGARGEIVKRMDK
jgi:allantoinase